MANLEPVVELIPIDEVLPPIPEQAEMPQMPGNTMSVFDCVFNFVQILSSVRLIAIFKLSFNVRLAFSVKLGLTRLEACIKESTRVLFSVLR